MLSRRPFALRAFPPDATFFRYRPSTPLSLRRAIARVRSQFVRWRALVLSVLWCRIAGCSSPSSATSGSGSAAPCAASSSPPPADMGTCAVVISGDNNSATKNQARVAAVACPTPSTSTGFCDVETGALWLEYLPGGDRRQTPGMTFAVSRSLEVGGATVLWNDGDSVWAGTCGVLTIDSHDGATISLHAVASLSPDSPGTAVGTITLNLSCNQVPIGP